MVYLLDSYMAEVNDNPDLLPVQKFTYLRSLLSRSARECIAGLTLTDANQSRADLVISRGLLPSIWSFRSGIMAREHSSIVHIV